MTSSTVTAPTVSVAQAAERLGVSERTVWRYLKAGRLEGVTVGEVGSQRTLICEDTLRALCQARTPGAANDASTRLAEATAELERLQAECAHLEARLRATQRARRDWRSLASVDVVVAVAASLAARLRPARTTATA